MRLNRLFPLLFVPLMASGGGLAPGNGEDVIRAMHDKYARKWYKIISFTQKTTQANGSVETWYEVLGVPGMLRIDIVPIDSGNAIIFRNDTVYRITAGVVQPGRPLIHPRLVLGFDVYGDSVARTIRKMKTFNIDFAKLSTNTWQGRPMYVVGAMAGDSTSPQFWVDQERLVFTRLIQKRAAGGVNETQFNKYSPIGGGWISAEVLFFTNSTPGTTEEYTNIKVGENFGPDFFNPAKFTKRIIR